MAAPQKRLPPGSHEPREEFGLTSNNRSVNLAPAKKPKSPRSDKESGKKAKFTKDSGVAQFTSPSKPLSSSRNPSQPSMLQPRNPAVLRSAPSDKATQQLQPPPIKAEQVLLGIRTLVEHSNKTLKKNIDNGQMFAGDVGSNESFVSLVISMKKIPNKEKHKPIKMQLKHPLLDPKCTPVCLVVKDPQRESKDLLAEKNINFISKVVGIEKLKGKHASFEARRRLLSSYGLFLADARVLPMLPNILGSNFFKSKKLPIPVNLTNPNGIKAELEEAISSTYLRLGTGSCVSIKIADLSRHDGRQIQANLENVIQHLGKRIPSGGWDNVQGLHIKTGTSLSLPIWLAGLNSDEFGRFALKPSQDELDAKKGAQDRKRMAVQDKLQKKKRRFSTSTASPASA